MQALYRTIAGRQTFIACFTSSRFWSSRPTAARKNTSVRSAASSATDALWSPGSSNSVCNSWLPGKHRHRLEKHLLDPAKGWHSRARRQCPLPVKNVPGRKTDISDSEWLARLGRFGRQSNRVLFRPKTFGSCAGSLSNVQKLAQILAGEKNRLHKVLD
ncbi:MAG: hypothetical protein ACRER2_15485 [Methylococcales bacterium]